MHDRSPDEPDEREHASACVIRARVRGPLCVEGSVIIYDAQGRAIDTAGRSKVLLCRCGASKTTPICDGSHNRTGFRPPNEE